MYFLQVYIKHTLSILQSHIRCILQVYFTKKKKKWCLFRVHLSQWIILWIEFKCLKAAESQWGLIFNKKVPRNSWYSLDWPLKDERLMQFSSCLMVLNIGPLVRQTCAPTTRPLLHWLCILLPVFCLAEIELYLKYTYVL